MAKAMLECLHEDYPWPNHHGLISEDRCNELFGPDSKKQKRERKQK